MAEVEFKETSPGIPHYEISINGLKVAFLGKLSLNRPDCNWSLIVLPPLSRKGDWWGVSIPSDLSFEEVKLAAYYFILGVSGARSDIISD